MKDLRCSKLLLAVGLSAILVVGLGCPGDNPTTPTQNGNNEAAGANLEMAPDFTLVDFQEGKEHKLSDYRGKIVVLEWFNHECPFVKYHYQEDVDTMRILADKFMLKDVVWLALNSTHHVTDQAVNEFIEDKGIKYPVLDDRSGEVGKKYDAKTTPHMFVIDKKGRLVYEGAIDNAPLGKVEGEKKNYVEPVLESLYQGEAVEYTKTTPYGCSVKYPK